MGASYCDTDRFGVRVQDIPHPEVDWSAFIAKVQDLNNQAGMVWSVKHNAPRHWIDTSRLTSVYGKGGCVIG